MREEAGLTRKKTSLSQIINLEYSMMTLRIDKMVRTPR